MLAPPNPGQGPQPPSRAQTKQALVARPKAKLARVKADYASSETSPPSATTRSATEWEADVDAAPRQAKAKRGKASTTLFAECGSDTSSRDGGAYAHGRRPRRRRAKRSAGRTTSEGLRRRNLHEFLCAVLYELYEPGTLAPIPLRPGAYADADALDEVIARHPLPPEENAEAETHVVRLAHIVGVDAGGHG